MNKILTLTNHAGTACLSLNSNNKSNKMLKIRLTNIAP